MNTVRFVLVGTELRQRALEALCAPDGPHVDVKIVHADGRMVVKGNGMVLGDVPSGIASVFGRMQKDGIGLRLVSAKLFQTKTGFADPRSAAFSLFDDDDEDFKARSSRIGLILTVGAELYGIETTTTVRKELEERTNG